MCPGARGRPPWGLYKGGAAADAWCRGASKRTNKPVPFDPGAFIARTPAFRLDAFQRLHRAAGNQAVSASSVLGYHVAQGHLVNVRRGLYAHNHDVDPMLLASCLTSDAVISYEGALAFHGYRFPLSRISVLSTERAVPLTFGGKRCVPARLPASLSHDEAWGGFIAFAERGGLEVRVTTLERTIVDLLDRLDLAPPPEHLLELANMPRVDPHEMIHYAEKLAHPVTAARLGVLLDRNATVHHQTRWRLDRIAPRSPSSWDRSLKGRGVWRPRWKMVVPEVLG